MKIDAAAVFIVLASLALSLTGCKSEEEGEWIEVPNFEYRNPEDYHPPIHHYPSEQKELDQNAWRTYRSAMSSAAEESQKRLNAYLLDRAEILSIDPKSIDDLPSAPDAKEREQIVTHANRVRDAVKDLKDLVENRREALRDFEAKVKEARDLCATTTSWSCRSTDPEFMTNCKEYRESDTCRAALRLREDKLLIEKNVEHYQDLLRALDQRVRRIDGPGARTVDA